MTGGRWLVTGGAGYIGAHVVRALLESGRLPVVLDDLSTGSRSRLPDQVELVETSVPETTDVTAAMQRLDLTGAIHLAAKKSPTESMTDPLLYARENVGGLISLLQAMCSTGTSRIVFSSSCSVYGTPAVEQVDEDAPPACFRDHVDALDAVRIVTGLPVPHELCARRPGDPARIVGRVDRIGRELGWQAGHDLVDMVGSAWDAELHRREVPRR